MTRRNRKRIPLPADPVRTTIESLSHDGRGVTHVEGKAVFVDGALPGEEVDFLYTARSRRHDEGKVVEVLRASVDRVTPKCAHFGICGGCSLQHMAPEAQIQAKQQVLLDNLRHIGKVEAGEILAPLTGPHWGYRNKARLGVKHVRKKGKVLVGFREKRTPYLAELERCEVLHPSVGERLVELAELIASLQVFERIAQIEVAVGEEATALVFRNLDPLDAEDTARLTAYAQRTGLHLWLQPAGPSSAAPLWPQESRLFYTLPAHELVLDFLPTDFTQVNPQINLAMIDHALALLEPRDHERILDLFCGLGNFSLPIARRAAAVVGVEGDAGLVQRARDNATRNGIDNCEFHAADLTQDPSGLPWMRQSYDKLFIDPPRSGAAEMMPWVARLKPQRIVYVSCHPASLARDAGLLVHEQGYRLLQAGVMDMFPHTAHVESIAVFARK